MDMTPDKIEALCTLLEYEAKRLPRNDIFAHSLAAIRQLQQPWRGMESAPRDGRRLLLSWPDGQVAIGRFDDERHHKKPRPMFVGHLNGVNWMRENQPIAWQPMPEPAPPETGQ